MVQNGKEIKMVVDFMRIKTQFALLQLFDCQRFAQGHRNLAQK